ncbi:hypothetical protein Tco_1350398 [Tanacetum coccineum]
MRSLGAVGSTIHSLIKFPTNHGIITMETSREALWECRQLERMQGSWKKDVEETLRKLKRVNIKIDPVMSSFGVKEERFLGHMVTKEGVRADPEKV